MEKFIDIDTVRGPWKKIKNVKYNSYRQTTVGRRRKDNQQSD